MLGTSNLAMNTKVMWGIYSLALASKPFFECFFRRKVVSVLSVMKLPKTLLILKFCSISYRSLTEWMPVWNSSPTTTTVLCEAHRHNIYFNWPSFQLLNPSKDGGVGFNSCNAYCMDFCSTLSMGLVLYRWFLPQQRLSLENNGLMSISIPWLYFTCWAGRIIISNIFL